MPGVRPTQVCGCIQVNNSYCSSIAGRRGATPRCIIRLRQASEHKWKTKRATRHRPEDMVVEAWCAGLIRRALACAARGLRAMRSSGWRTSHFKHELWITTLAYALKELHASWDNEMRCQGCRFPPRAMLRRRGRVPVRRNSRHLYFSCTLLFFVPNVTLRVVVWLGWYATAADVQLLRAIDPADGLEGLHERPRKGHGVRFCVNSTSFARRL